MRESEYDAWRTTDHDGEARARIDDAQQAASDAWTKRNAKRLRLVEGQLEAWQQEHVDETTLGDGVEGYEHEALADAITAIKEVTR